MEYTIENETLALTASAAGGALGRLSTRQGLPLLGEGTFVCFPWCGAIEGGWYEDRGFPYREAGGTDGFAREKEHLPAGRESGRLAFRLEWPGSLGLWPWAFELESVHTLAGNRAESVCTAENRSGRPMPVQWGFQAGLCCPFLPETGAEEYQLRFADGRVLPVTAELPEGPVAPADWVRLEHRETGRYLEVDTKAFPLLSLGWGDGTVLLGLRTGGGPGHDLAARPGTARMEHGEKRSWRLAVTASL